MGVEVGCCMGASGLLSDVTRQALTPLPSPLAGLGWPCVDGSLSCPELQAVDGAHVSPHGPQLRHWGMRPVRRVLSRAPMFLFYAI